MSRLIDADRLYEVIKSSWDTSDAEDFEKSVFIALATAPTIEERKKGKWIGLTPEEGHNIYTVKCDQCGKYDFFETNFCPNCGADMRGEQDEY